MAKLTILGLGCALIAGPALAQDRAQIGAPSLPTMPMPQAMPQSMNNQRIMPRGPMPQVGMDRWNHVPGGYGAYRRPSYGYTLPSYWVAPTYYLPNYQVFGLPRPSSGFGWSRYYDDAVMTDRYGRVYDWRSDMDWDREDYADSYGYRDDRPYGRSGGRGRGDGGVAGAVVGGVVGGIAGNVIAGRGNRTAGTLIGAGVGAVAGGLIGSSSGSRRYDAREPRYDGREPRFEGRAHRSGKSGHYTYDGRWTGSWNGGPTQTYDGRFDGDVHPHWATRGGHDGYTAIDQGYAGYGYSYGHGYGGGATTTTTTTTTTTGMTYSQPIVTRSVRYITEYSHAAPKRRVIRYGKDRRL